MTEKATIEITRSIPFPPARVWQALTDPTLLAQWWAAGDVRPEVGHRFTLNMGTFGEQSCRVLEAEPDRLFAYTFGEGWLDTTITWRLEPEDGGTTLTLEHAGFDLESEMGARAYQGMGGGWPSVLDRLEPALAQG